MSEASIKMGPRVGVTTEGMNYNQNSSCTISDAIQLFVLQVGTIKMLMRCTSLHTKTRDIQRIPSHHICQSFFFKGGSCQWLTEWPTCPKLIELVPKTSFRVRFMVRFSPSIIHLCLNLAPCLLPNFNWWTHY